MNKQDNLVYALVISEKYDALFKGKGIITRRMNNNETLKRSYYNFYYKKKY